MEKVTTQEGVEYGLSVLGYVIALGIAATLAVWAGSQFTGTAGILGGLIALAGVIIAVAGVVGLQFKIIADAVAAGLLIYHDESA